MANALLDKDTRRAVSEAFTVLSTCVLGQGESGIL